LKHPYHHLQSSHNQGEMTAAIMILTDAIKFQKLESRNDNPPPKKKKTKEKKRKLTLMMNQTCHTNRI
jgi:hypothetical protein